MLSGRQWGQGLLAEELGPRRVRPGAAADAQARLLFAAAIGFPRFSIRQGELEKALWEAQLHLLWGESGAVELGMGIVLLQMWKLRVAMGLRKLLAWISQVWQGHLLSHLDLSRCSPLGHTYLLLLQHWGICPPGLPPACL